MNTDNFQWTDELVKEIVTNALDLMHETTKHDCSDEYIAKFKASKQKPKDWEIVILETSSGAKCHNPNGLCTMVGLGDKIVSVRRLSDGEVFTVGERATYDIATAPIKEFSITDDRMYVTGGEDAGHSFGCFLADLSKPKQPLFTTEDGKPVYVSHSYWYVNTAWAVGCVPCAAFENAEEKPYRKYFSTKEAADDYILLNKPMLSVQEVMNRLHAYFGNPIYAFDNIKSFAKSKLQ